MPLFEIKKRANSRANDSAIVQKANSKAKQVAPTVKGKGNLLDRIDSIRAMVEKYLGKYRDRYIVINDEEILSAYIDTCIDNHYISIDTETDGLDPLVNNIAGICIYTYGEKGAYIPLNHISYITQMVVPNQLSKDVVIPQFERLLETKPDIDMFNAKFDIRFMRAYGIKDIYCTWDGYLASMLMNENDEEHNLKWLHKKYVLDGNEDAFRFDDLFKGIPFTMIPINVGYLYAARDPEITSELCDYQRQYLRPDSDRQDMVALYNVLMQIEMPCVSVVADMEDTGILFDMEYRQQLSDKYNKLLQEKLDTFNELVSMYDKEIEDYKIKNPNHKLDTPINVASPTQLAILFYDIIGCDSVDPKSPRGTGEEILKKLDNPIADAILEWRSMSKLVDTYIDKLPNCVNQSDGRIHCSFNQYGAKTGRFSSSDPNLQNIPSHNKDIRKMFIASPGYVLMSSDYSQQEPKVMTQMCGDPKMIQAYMEGKDLYAEIASLSFNTTYDNCLEFRQDGTTNPEGKARRSQAKSILLGVLYGRGVPSIAEQLRTTTKKAQEIKDSVFKGFPAIPKFEQDSLAMAQELGYVTTLWGRKRRLPELQLEEYEFTWKDGTPPDDDILDFDSEETVQEIPERTKRKYLTRLHNSWGSQKRKIFEDANAEGIWIVDNGAKIADASRQCVNARIQGSAADMSKLAMILVGNDTRLKELGFRLLIPVHDELIAECPEENVKECSERFAQLMSEAAKSRLEIPIKCDVEITKAWYGESINA